MTNKTISYAIPDVYAAASWDALYSDIHGNDIAEVLKKVDVTDIIKDIPTVVILHHVAMWMNFLVYAPISNTNRQRIWNELRRGLPKGKVNRMLRFMQKTPQWTIATTESLSYLTQLSIANFCNLSDYDDNDLDLSLEEREKLFDAILYLNSLWQYHQIKGIDDNEKYTNIVNLSLRMDLPIVEFKKFKDFKVQLFKAISFFTFLENDEHYRTLLPLFYNDYNVTDWKNYLLLLFGFLEASIRTPYVNVSPETQHSAEIIKFLNQFLIDINNPVVKTFHADLPIPSYYRDHFLVAMSRNYYQLLNPNLLADKFFQGLKFQMFQTIEKHSFLSAKRKPIQDQPTFNSLIGVPFTEKTLLYKVLKLTFPESDWKHLTEQDFEHVGRKDAAPDYYLRKGTDLFLIECKDLTLGDKIKYSDNIDFIRNELLDRLCRFDEQNSRGKIVNKGAGQLHYAIKNIYDKDLLDSLDNNWESVKSIYPIIIVTDTAFSAIGVNALIVEKYIEIARRAPIDKDVFIHIPTIIDIDTLIHLSYRISEGFIDLAIVLNEYHKNNYFHLKPFTTVMYDKYINGHILTRDELKHLFGDFFPE